jgi:NADPH:quinone reductase
MRAIQVERFGGPEVLELVEVPDPVPDGDEILLEVTGVGVNYADTHQAENSYLSRSTLPFVPGSEVVGLAPDGTRRCGFVTRGGGYAERAVVSAATSFVVPEPVSDPAALSLLVQGLTAWHLLRTSARMQPGESVVVHAAAGGVGSLAVQLARTWGAGRVIGTASTPDKRALAESLGAHLTVEADSPALALALRKANDGAKVDVVLEMVGGRTFDESLLALARFGRLVTYGMASRENPSPLAPGSLMVGSKSVIGFWLVDCMTPERATTMVASPLAELVGMVADGKLRPVTGTAYPLADARRAHEDLRARRTTGKVVLDPRVPGSGS